MEQKPTLAFIREERGEGGDGAASGEEGEDQRERDEQDVDEYMKSEYICYGLPRCGGFGKEEVGQPPRTVRDDA